MGFSRADCLIWIEKNGFKIPKKSSCIGCPYHSDGVWRDMKLNDKKSWDDAVKIDKYIRDNSPNIKSTVFTHRTCQPLDEVDLRNLSDLGQGDLFNDECEGLCGV